MKKLLTIFTLLCMSVVGWATNWSEISWLANATGNAAYTNKYKALAGDPGPSNIDVIQNPAWATAPGLYVTFPNADFRNFSLPASDYDIQGAGVLFHMSTFTAKETKVHVNVGGTVRSFTIYYDDGTEGPTEVYDINFALVDNGSSATASSGTAANAIDGNEGSRWESSATDDETWTLDMGQKRIFNTIKILWEGAYCKEFALTYSNDGESWSALYTETNLTHDGWQTIELASNVTAQYIKYHGTKRATTYGQSFWEFQVLLPGVSVLTSINLSAAAAIAQVGGQGVVLTAQPKDQNNNNMEAEVSYEITPAAAGHMTGNTYIPDQVGVASIRAYNGEIFSQAVTIAAYQGSNLALNNLLAHSTEYEGYGAARAVDGNDGTEWQGSSTNGTAADEASRTYDCWFTVDLGAAYDIDLITIHFEGACSDAYHIDFSADNSSWNTGYNFAQVMGINGHTDYITSFTNNTSVRYVRFWSTKASTQWGMKIFEFQVFGSESASATKTVSASANTPAMGTATVKQNNVDVTEVETGSTVTFSAVANEGYIFVNWSNGETNATFNAEVNSTMNLTANFRAIKTVYCMTEMEKNGHTIYVTMKRSAADTYQLVVRANEELQGFGNAYFYRPNNIQVGNISQMQELSDNNHTLTATMTAATEPYMTTPLYVIIRGVGEVAFDQLTDIEYAAECDDNASVTSVTISRTTVSVAVGDEFDLTAQVIPAFATNKNITWSSDNTSVATVTSAGHVATLAEGTARITATSVDGGYTATCTVTVNAELETQTYWGNGSNSGIAIAYSITRNSDYTLTYVLDVLHQKTGFVPEVNYPDENAYHNMTYDNESQTYSHTTTLTYSDGDVINGFFWLKYEGGVVRIDFTYTVGSSSERQAYIPIEFDDNAEDASWINENDGKTRDVEIDRTLLANGYYKTICFPFSMDAEQIEATFGNCEILMLSGGHMKSETDIYVQYVPVHEIIAGKPYLMTNESEVAGLDFSGVLINSSTANNEIEVDLGGGKKITMIGTFFKKSLTDDDLYYLDIDGFLHSVSAYGSENSGAAVTIAAFRCYYQFEGFNNPAGVRARVVRVTDVVTGCEDLTEPTVATKQLLNGQLLIFRDGKSYTVTGLRIE